MPRQPRYNLPGLPQHVIQRGNNRQAVFFDDGDYHRYLADLDEIAADTGCQIHAFVLMTNHVHLLVTPAVSNGICKLMQGLGRRYVAYVNHIYRRSYKASLVAEDNYLLSCMRYIELNPVRAGMVIHPGDYRWSSYHHNAYGERCGLSVVEHSRYLALAGAEAERRECYRDLFSNALDHDLIHSIRQTLNSCLVLGNERFKDEIEVQLKRKVRPGKAWRPSKIFQSDPVWCRSAGVLIPAVWQQASVFRAFMTPFESSS